MLKLPWTAQHKILSKIKSYNYSSKQKRFRNLFPGSDVNWEGLTVCILLKSLSLQNCAFENFVLDTECRLKPAWAAYTWHRSKLCQGLFQQFYGSDKLLLPALLVFPIPLCKRVKYGTKWRDQVYCYKTLYSCCIIFVWGVNWRCHFSDLTIKFIKRWMQRPNRIFRYICLAFLRKIYAFLFNYRICKMSTHKGIHTYMHMYNPVMWLMVYHNFKHRTMNDA